MPRIRSIKPDYWKSEKLATRCPGPDGREARRLFIGLWNLAEDHGVTRANPSYLRSELYPYDDDVTTADVARWVGMLERGTFVVCFQRDGSAYLWIRGFKDHQRINRPSPTALPEPPLNETEALTESSLSPHGALTESSLSPHGALTESSLSPHGALTAGREGKGNRREIEMEGEAPAASPPSGSVSDPGAAFGALPTTPGMVRKLADRRNPDTPPEAALIRAWNAHTALPLPRCTEETPDRLKRAGKALKRRPMEQWVEIFQRISASAFCRGEGGDWRADFEWAIRAAGTKPEPAQSVLEGKYDARDSGCVVDLRSKSPVRAEDISKEKFARTGDVTADF